MDQLTLTPLTTLAQRPLPPMVIEGLLPEKGIVILQGKSGVGKSFFGLEMALAAVTGMPAFEKFKVRSQVRTLYVAKDSAGWDLAAQARKLIAGKGLNLGDFLPHAKFGLDFFEMGPPEETMQGQWEQSVIGTRRVEGLTFFEEPPGLLVSDEGTKVLERVVVEGQYQLVILDTLLALHGMNENDNGVMQGVMERIKRLAKHATVLALAHTAKPGEVPRDGVDRVRGAGAIAGSLDGCLELVRTNDDQIEVRVQKQRACKFHPFRYWMEDTDDAVTMRFVEDVEDQVPACVLEMLAGGEMGWGEIVARLQAIDPRATEGGSLKVESTAAYHAGRVLRHLIRQGKVMKIRRGVYALVTG